MLAAQLNAPHDLELVTKDRPTRGPGEVLLKIEANTLCGTDYRLYTGAKTAGVRPGVVPGHELAGRVAAIGESAMDIMPGLEVAGTRRCRSSSRADTAATAWPTANTCA